MSLLGIFQNRLELPFSFLILLIQNSHMLGQVAGQDEDERDGSVHQGRGDLPLHRYEHCSQMFYTSIVTLSLKSKATFQFYTTLWTLNYISSFHGDLLPDLSSIKMFSFYLYH